MKGIIFVPSIEETSWVQEILPGRSPAELPIAGKRYIDYALEYAERRGYEMAEILDWNFSERLAADFSNITGYSIPVFYQKGNGEMPKSAQELSAQASPLTENINSDTCVVWGLRLGDTAIRNVSDWHKANMDILGGEECCGNRFTLPGYSAEGGVYLGRNVVMEHGFEAKTPVLLQDNVWCARNVRLGGFCIIGNGAYIDEGAHLERTVVGDDTYIGIGLELVNKIVIGRRVIDAETGVWTDMEEPGLASRIGGGTGFLRKVFDFIRGQANRRVF